MISLLGLLLAILFWIGILWGIAWTWNRHVEVLLASGVQVDEADQHMTIKRVARYHTVGLAITFFIFFLVLGLATFPLWQLLGIAGCLSLYFGPSAVARSEDEWTSRHDPGDLALLGRQSDAIWYRVLMVLEWAFYLGIIVLAAYLLVEAVT